MLRSVRKYSLYAGKFSRPLKWHRQDRSSVGIRGIFLDDARISPPEAVTFFAEWPEASVGPARRFHKTIQLNISCRRPIDGRSQDDEKLNPPDPSGWTGICGKPIVYSNLSSGSL